MSLQFIIGSSGSGKTRRLYRDLIERSVREPRSSFIAIVPEQFTMQTQKEIVALHPDHGTMNIDIVSFNRLAYRIFEELAVEHLDVLDDMGKSMVLRKVAAEQRQNLSLYAGHLNQTGFINQLKSMLSELYQYGVGPLELERARDEAGSALLKAKCGDLAVICRAFQEAIEKRFITAEEILDVLCRELPRSELIKRSVITLDGYTGFTPVQYRLLELMMIHARQVIVTVTMDPAAHPYQRGRMQNLFYMGKEIIYKLTELAVKNAVERDEDILLGAKEADGTEAASCGRFADSPSIAFIEKHLYRYRETASWEPKEVEIRQASGPAEEVAGTAAAIHELVRDGGIRYREIAVITGDLDGYRHEIANRFRMEGIPYFMDNKKSILENTMVEFIRAALETVRKDFDYESMFRFLKTGLVTDDREELGRLENYCIALGIRGFKRWNDTWEYTYRGGGDLNLDQLNRFRQEVLSPLAALRASLREEGRTIKTMNRAVLDCLETCRVKEKLEEYREYFETVGQYSLAKEYEQVYDRVTELFDRLTALLGDERVSLKEYTEILDAGFGEIQVGVIPATVDRVVVGDITRTRLDQIRVLFLIGVNEGVVPSRKDAPGLLTDMDREILKECQVELAPASKEDSFCQRYYLYLTMTKPSDRLILSYSLFDQAGKSRRPSSLIGEMKRLFPALKIRESDSLGAAALSRTAGKELLIRELRSYAAGEIDRPEPGRPPAETGFGEGIPSGGQDGSLPSAEAASGKGVFPSGRDGTGTDRKTGSGEGIISGGQYGARPDSQDESVAAGGAARARRFLELYRWFSAQPEYAGLVRMLTEAAFYSYEERGISKAAARALYGAVMQGSVTRLERYAACAYAHFLQFGLELMERQQYQVAAMDMGNLFHSSIELCFRELEEKHLSLTGLDDESRRELVSRCVSQVTSEYGNTILMSSARNRHLASRIERMTERTVWALAEQLKKGDFQPGGYEVSFSAIDDLNAMKIRLSEEEQLHLRGRIDRLDLCEDGDQMYVKIIDYKSGSTQFDLAAVYHGLQLQLVVYMDAVMELTGRKYPDREIVPAGIFYYNIKDPLADRQQGQTAEDIDAEILRQLRMNGLVNSDLEAIRHMDRQIEQKSDVIPVAIKDGLVQERYSSVASGKRFEVLRRYVRRQLKQDGEEILSGNTAVRPHKEGSRTACDYCPYHGVCGFDTRISGYRYRRFRPVEPEEIWADMEEKAGPENEAGAGGETAFGRAGRDTEGGAGGEAAPGHAIEETAGPDGANGIPEKGGARR